MVCETVTITILKYIGYGCAVIVFEYLQIPGIQFTILGILMIIDFFAGVSKQFVIDAKEITSHKAWLGVMKKSWTLISVIVVALMLSVIFFGKGEQYIISMIALLIMAETYSILQNIYIIRTGEKITEYDVVSRVIKGIGELIIGAIEKTLKK